MVDDEAFSLKNLISLKDRRALITGATGGFGLQITLILAELGAELILLDQPGSDFSSVLKKIRQSDNPDAEIIDCDLEDETSRSKLIKKLNNQPKGLNILVNNAAFVGTTNLEGWNTNFQQQSLDTWRRTLEVNLTTIFDLSKGLAKKLKKSGKGSIINIGSIYGTLAPDYSLYEGTEMGNPAAYAVSKGGLIQLTRWLSTTLAPEVRVNAISPGGVFRDQPKNLVQRYIKKTPLSRMARDEDIKGVMAFLASDLSSYITGQNIMMDGGFSVW